MGKYGKKIFDGLDVIFEKFYFFIFVDGLGGVLSFKVVLVRI